MSPYRKAATRLWLGLLAAGAPLALNAAHAETPTTPTPPAPPAIVPSPTLVDGKVSYPPDFFAAFSPRTALDMVRRVPGFSIDGGDDRRGFSGTAGNVLIDGERPSAKSQDVGDILSRIPADQVARVELLRGAQSNEASGQTQVVNVVRRVSDSAQPGAGLYELDFEFALSGGRTTPRGSASYAGRVGEWDFNLGVSRYAQFRDLNGLRWIREADDALLATRSDITPRTFRDARITGALSGPLLGGKFNLNAEAGRENFRTVLDSAGFSPLGTPTDSFELALNYRTRNREIGLDFERAFGGVTAKIVGLDRRSWQADDDTTTAFTTTGGVEDITAQKVRNDARESIVRLTLSGAPLPGLTVETGAEVAYNALEAGLDLSVDVGAGPVPIPLPGANVLIEEDRAEAFVRGVWGIGDGWTLEGGLAFETSTISQSGDTDASRTLSYWKPSVQLTRAFGDKNQWRVRLFRDVGQLDFDDFATSADLNDDRVAAGNPGLKPNDEWRLEGALDMRWGEKGAFSITVYRLEVADVVDSAPLVTTAGVFDAPANIGDGWAQGVEITATLPLDGVLPGAVLEVATELARSEVTDPVTKRARSASGFSDVSFDVELRQDIPALKLSWGVEYEGEGEFERFRLGERETYVEGPFLSGFVETTALPVKVRLYAFNLTDTTFRRERRFFTPTRAGAPDDWELRKRHFGRFIGLEFSGKF
jgi:hypothetical protein